MKILNVVRQTVVLLGARTSVVERLRTQNAVVQWSTASFQAHVRPVVVEARGLHPHLLFVLRMVLKSLIIRTV